MEVIKISPSYQQNKKPLSKNSEKRDGQLNQFYYMNIISRVVSAVSDAGTQLQESAPGLKEIKQTR